MYLYILKIILVVVLNTYCIPHARIIKFSQKKKVQIITYHLLLDFVIVLLYHVGHHRFSSLFPFGSIPDRVI